MKVASACLQCRESKRKCSRPTPGEPCYSCQQRKLQCDSRSQPQRVASEATASVATTLAIDNLSWKTTVELIEIYLDKVHDRPHSLFHPPTLWTQLRNGSTSRALIYAICAIGVKYSCRFDRQSLELQLTTEAKWLLKADLENVCLENIQTCILLSTLSAGNCENSSEALYIRKRSPPDKSTRGQLHI